MFRLLLTILIALPMLMPPGMCVCQFAPIASNEAVTRFEMEERHVAGRTDCHCASCLGRAVDDVGRKAMPYDSPVAPKHDDHSPHCPAALGDLPTKMAVPAITIHLDTDVGFISAVVEGVAIRARTIDVVNKTESFPPLFISHCTLVI
jgi:hypothetical protein